MGNSYFIYPTYNKQIHIERFHNCTWEFDSGSSLVEFGFEVTKDCLKTLTKFELVIYIPWLTEKCGLKNLYENLVDTANSKFIFNDFVTTTTTFDGGANRSGVIHGFNERESLCFLPVILDRQAKKVIVKVDLTHYNKHNGEKPNIYFRFSIKPSFPYVSTRKNGISKSTVIYDIKFNERRNIPDELLDELSTIELCKITHCYCFNILPNKYDIVFYDNSSLKSVRALEYESFNRYIGDRRIKRDDLIVVFNRKKGVDSFSFFSIFSKERIGIAQFSMAILLNVLCSMLFFIAGFRTAPKPGTTFGKVILALPNEMYISLLVLLVTILYFVWPYLKKGFSPLINLTK